MYFFPKSFRFVVPVFFPSGMSFVAMGFFVLSVGSFFSSLRADTLFLKNGRVFKNVKTKIRGPRIYVYPPNGRPLSFPAARIRSLIPAPVHWPKKGQKDAVPNTTKKAISKKQQREERKRNPVNDDSSKNKFQRKTLEKRNESKTKKGPQGKKKIPERQENKAQEVCLNCKTNFWQNPWALGLQGALPLWSGLYQNKDTRLYGYFLSGLELVALLNFGAYSKSAVPLQEARLPELVLLSASVPATTVPLSGPHPPFNAQVFVSSYLLLAMQNQVVLPDGQSLARNDFEAKRRRSGIFFLAVLAADAFVSVLYGAPPSVQTSLQDTSPKRQAGFGWNFRLAPSAFRSRQTQAGLRESADLFQPQVEFRWYF